MSYLEFEERGTSESGLTKRWVVFSSANNTVLGWINWKAGWRKYTFSPMTETTFDASCLNEIASFLHVEMDKR